MLYNQNWDKDSIPSILNRAADILETRGHIKGALHRRGSGFCAIGAIMSAAGLDDTTIAEGGWGFAALMGEKDRIKDVAQVVANTITDIGMLSPLIHWNNATDRTGAEVAAKFREVASTYVTA